jgi:uncharacterized Zn-binding protein involved in type VI secretion
MIGFMPAWRAMIDQHACPLVSISGPDGIGSVMMGSPTVLINNMMACRMGDIVVEKPGLAAGPMDPIVLGCPTVIIGEVGMGGATGPMGMAMSAAKASASAYIQAGNPSQLLGSEIQGVSQPGLQQPGQQQPGLQQQNQDQPKLEWIGIRLVNESGDDISGEELSGHTTDGEQHQIEVANGQQFSQIPGGSCKFTFPKFYDAIKNWTPEDDE